MLRFLNRDSLRNSTLCGGLLVLLTTLAGCGVGSVVSPSSNATGESAQLIPAVRINGHVHGGAYPIQKATVVLMETQSNGVWTSAQKAYVGTGKALYATTSDANGFFTFPDTGWGCDAGQYVYIEVTGGSTASSSNPNVVQVGVVGNCATDLGNTAEIDGLNVFLSEPSTVAAAYALRGFIATHNGTLSGVANDGTVSTTTNIPLVDITAPFNNNAVPANPSLNPVSTATGAVQVSLASAFNAYGIYNDGDKFTTGGFDNGGNAYSEQLVGTSVTYNGLTYALGDADVKDIVRGGSSVAISLPSGYFNKLNFLAAGANGNQASQTFTVTYTDGSTTSFTQSVSDWFTPQNYSGEGTALATTYRDKANGTKDSRPFNVYQYSLSVNSGKLVKSLTLPNNTNVAILAITATSNLPTCTFVSASTPLTCTAAGLAHGFQNAYNLVDQVTFNANQTPSGVTRTTLPTNSKAIVPREMINTLGNILQECVDSGGGTASSPYTVGTSRCGDLFYYTTPPSGTAPTNTLQAAINMANYPANNVSSLMALKPRTVFFTPEISQPSSPQTFQFTLSIFYTGTALGDTFAKLGDLALDSQDDVYLVYGGTAQNQTPAVLDELTPAGKGLFSTTLSSVANPKSLALDSNGFVWVSDDTASTGGNGSGGGNITGLYTSVNATKSLAQGSAYKSISIPYGAPAGLAFDASSNMFVTRDSSDTNNTAVLFTAASTYGTSYGYALGFPFQHAQANSQGNFYAVGTTGSSSGGFTYNFATCGTGTAPIVSTAAYTGATSLAINNNVSPATGYSDAFAPINGAVISFTNSVKSDGSNCSSTANSEPAGNQTGVASKSPLGAAMDGNLSLFWSDSTGGLIYSMLNVGSSTNISSAAVGSFAPCYYTGGACASTSGAAFQGMAIDSSGAMWVLSNGGTYGLVQTLGYAAPTWPLLASENSGVVVQ